MAPQYRVAGYGEQRRLGGVRVHWNGANTAKVFLPGWTGDNELAPGAVRTFRVAPGHYTLRITCCLLEAAFDFAVNVRGGEVTDITPPIGHLAIRRSRDGAAAWTPLNSSGGALTGGDFDPELPRNDGRVVDLEPGPYRLKVVKITARVPEQVPVSVVTGETTTIEIP